MPAARSRHQRTLPVSSTSDGGHEVGERGSDGRRPWLRASLVALSVVLILQPIDGDSVWWDAARGRALVAGAVAPSAAIQAGDPCGEADWLGGLAWYLLVSAGGPTALMLARVVGVACGLASCLWLCRKCHDQVSCSAATAAALVAASPGFDPTSLWWDVIGGYGMIAWHAAHGDAGTQPARATAAAGMWIVRRREIGACIVAVAWANLGPRSLLALAMPGVSGSQRALVTAGLCLTPRGPLGLVDSAWTLVPPLEIIFREGGDPVLLSAYAISGPAPCLIQFVAWLALGAIALFRWTGPQPNAPRMVPWIILLGLLVANPSSLPALVPFAWWLAVGGMWPPMQALVPTGLRRAGLPGTVAVRGAMSQRRIANGLATIVALGALFAATGPWLVVPWRAGWGLSARLEYRQILEPLMQCGRGGTAFAFDERTAGMIAWARPDGPQPWLVPHRAIIAGQFVAEATRAAEVRAGWDMRQTAIDGSPGGWWVPLMSRDTRLIVVSDTDTMAIRSLEPGIFKPLVIDAPVVPFARAGDPASSPAILQGVADRILVEDGAWSFALPRPTWTDWSFDICGLLTGRPDPRPLLRQADVLLAMQLPRAALKILLPMARAGLADCTTRLIDANVQIAEGERVSLGAPSAFRAGVLERLGARPVPQSELAGALARIHEDIRRGALDRTMVAVDAYLTRGAVDALQTLSHEERTTSWSGAMLELEAGRPIAAREILERLSTHSDRSLAAAASDMLERLAAVGSP